MPQTVDTLIQKVMAAVRSNLIRRFSFWRCHSLAKRLAPRFPLIHKTGVEGMGDTWRDIFKHGYLAPRGACPSPRGRPAVFFFWGHAAYDLGLVALLMDLSVLEDDGDSTFTPFDTGGLLATPPLLGHDPAVSDWSALATRRAFLEQHTGNGKDVDVFGATYLAAHFKNPRRYLTNGQTEPPDFPPYHGLRNDDQDRRSWTVEAQAYGDVPVYGAQLLKVVVKGVDRVRGLPSSYLRRVVVANGTADDFNTKILSQVHSIVEN